MKRNVKMEKPTYAFRETNLVLQFPEESRIKKKTVMSWSSRREKRLFCHGEIFVAFVILSQCIDY